jgi:hypothetical protein
MNKTISSLPAETHLDLQAIESNEHGTYSITSRWEINKTSKAKRSIGYAADDV